MERQAAHACGPAGLRQPWFKGTCPPCSQPCCLAWGPWKGREGRGEACWHEGRTCIHGAACSIPSPALQPPPAFPSPCPRPPAPSPHQVSGYFGGCHLPSGQQGVLLHQIIHALRQASGCPSFPSPHLFLLGKCTRQTPRAGGWLGTEAMGPQIHRPWTPSKQQFRGRAGSRAGRLCLKLSRLTPLPGERVASVLWLPSEIEVP